MKEGDGGGHAEIKELRTEYNGHTGRECLGAL